MTRLNSPVSDRLKVHWHFFRNSPVEHAEHDTYLALRANAEIIEADRYGEKVLRLADGRMLKLFRRKRLVSSAAWYPYAQRFADNCAALSTRGIPCPEVIAVYRFREMKRDAVLYQPLPGETIRQLRAAGISAEDAARLRQAIARFIGTLHDRGIYFRSLHLGNIVRTPEGELGLIDVADMTVRKGALSRMTRRRNMQHLLRYRNDADWLAEMPDFFRANLSRSGLF